VRHANLLWELHKQELQKVEEARRAREKQHARSLASLTKHLEDERERIFTLVEVEKGDVGGADPGGPGGWRGGGFRLCTTCGCEGHGLVCMHPLRELLLVALRALEAFFFTTMPGASPVVLSPKAGRVSLASFPCLSLAWSAYGV